MPNDDIGYLRDDDVAHLERLMMMMMMMHTSLDIIMILHTSGIYHIIIIRYATSYVSFMT